MYFRLVVVDVDGKLSRVRIDAMRQVQVVVLAPLMMLGERWAALIAASLPILAEALISRRVGSMVPCDGLSEIRLFRLYRPSVLFRARCSLLGPARVRLVRHKGKHGPGNELHYQIGREQPNIITKRSSQVRVCESADPF